MNRCNKCNRPVFASIVFVGGEIDGSIRTGATVLCPPCAGEEIERLKDLLASTQQELADLQTTLGDTRADVRMQRGISEHRGNQVAIRDAEIERLTEELAQSQERATVRKRERDAARDVGRFRGGER